MCLVFQVAYTSSTYCLTIESLFRFVTFNISTDLLDEIELDIFVVYDNVLVLSLQCIKCNLFSMQFMTNVIIVCLCIQIVHWYIMFILYFLNMFRSQILADYKYLSSMLSHNISIPFSRASAHNLHIFSLRRLFKHGLLGSKFWKLSSKHKNLTLARTLVHVHATNCIFYPHYKIEMTKIRCFVVLNGTQYARPS